MRGDIATVEILLKAGSNLEEFAYVRFECRWL